jgi:hypothetical protein
MRLGSIAVGVAVLVLFARSPRAGEVLIGAQVGAGHMPLSDWEEYSDFGAGYEADPLGQYWEVSATWRFAPRHAARLSVERITTSAVATYEIPSLFTITVDWEFKTWPICLNYEFTLRRSDSDAYTLLGAGGGFYTSEVQGTEVISDPLVYVVGTRSGDGYGFHGYLRQTAPISEQLSLSGMVRGRWADGMAFDDEEGDIPVEFSGFDMAIGLEWKI